MFKLLISQKIMVLVTLLIMGDFTFAQTGEQVLSDPTRPANMMMGQSVDSVQQENTNSYKVSQIYIGKKNKLAIINGQKVQQGDRVDGAEVLAINSERVQLSVNGRLIEIAIMPSIKKYTK